MKYGSQELATIIKTMTTAAEMIVIKTETAIVTITTTGMRLIHLAISA